MPLKPSKIKKIAKDPRVDFKRADTKTPPGTEIRPDVEIQPDASDTSGWMTRYESADSLGVSITTIANYERDGKLHPRHEYRNTRGFEQRVKVYDPRQLEPLRKYAASPSRERIKDPGELAARCFELLDQGRTLREIVIALRQTPERIRELHESWLDAGGADFTITPVARESFEKIVGAFSSVAELMTLVENLAQRAELGAQT